MMMVQWSWTLKVQYTEVFCHSTNTLDRQPDGSVVIVPHYRELPNEIVSCIVDHVSTQQDLYACTLVNKQFHEEANPLLWYSPELNNETSLNRILSYLSDADQPSILAQFIRKLYLKGNHWTNTYLSLLMPYLRQLQQLEIDGSGSYHDSVNITSDSLKHLPRHCRNLESLNIKGIDPCKSFFFELGRHCHQLYELYLDSCFHLSPNTFNWLAACPLESLHIEFKSLHNKALSDQLVTDLIRFHLLTDLKIEGLDFQLLLTKWTSSHNNSNTTTTTPSSIWPYLTRLHLSSMSSANDATFIPFIKSHSQLQDLDLHGNSNFTDAALASMGGCLPLLTRLSVAGNAVITHQGIRRLIRNSRRLSFIDIRCCKEIKPGPMLGLAASESSVVTLDQALINRIRQAVSRPNGQATNASTTST
ncbi:hypothetical protein BCR42DRAFT_428918 [Absidia repens]|uniref:F-box domain-containing protein n=1 Tax=Absidia repens TaxID=90262 RepID=A0A1X2HXM2_9FUNG|nr:hypothetical protein BCR42DRAFT_428918 [Absidia repens]